MSIPGITERDAPTSAPAPSPLEGQKPDLWFTESRLQAAFEAMDAVLQLEDEDPTRRRMTPADARALVAEYVNNDTAIARRDEFADFVRASEDLLEAKRARLAADKKAIERLEQSVARMKWCAAEVMERSGNDRLVGRSRTIKLKRGRGRVEVFDESAVPEEFLRVAEPESDLDVVAIYRLEESVREVAKLVAAKLRKQEREAIAASHVAAAQQLLNEARKRRTSVDKKSVQLAWKEHDGQDYRPKNAGELLELANDPDAQRALEVLAGKDAERLEFLRRHALIVPGCTKQVDLSIEIQ